MALFCFLSNILRIFFKVSGGECVACDEEDGCDLTCNGDGQEVRRIKVVGGVASFWSLTRSHWTEIDRKIAGERLNRAPTVYISSRLQMLDSWRLPPTSPTARLNSNCSCLIKIIPTTSLVPENTEDTDREKRNERKNTPSDGNGRRRSTTDASTASTQNTTTCYWRTLKTSGGLTALSFL